MQKLIVIEGLDGSGKATQAAELLASMQRREMRVRKVSFPDYESRSSSLIKMYLNGEFGTHPDDVNAYAASSFFAVDRYASYKRDWAEDYKNGVIISDRYTTSNAIHQCSKLPEEEWDSFLDWLFDYEYRLLAIPKPDAVIYLRVDPEVSQRLLKERYHGEDKRDIHEKDRQYLERCQRAADYCCQKLGWQVVECCEGGFMRSVEEIRKKVISLIDFLPDD